MPRYVIERQFLLPIYEHILIQAPSLEAACREALDEWAQPWGDDSKQDFDSAGPVTVSRAVELPDSPTGSGRDLGRCGSLGHALYSAGLTPLPIPAEFSAGERGRR